MTQLRLIDPPDKINAKTVQPGDMWRDIEHDIEGHDSYYVCIAHSPLPHPVLWYTTQRDSATNDLWEVSGTPPNITVTPSINAEPYWHGHITNGELNP